MNKTAGQLSSALAAPFNYRIERCKSLKCIERFLKCRHLAGEKQIGQTGGAVSVQFKSGGKVAKLEFYKHWGSGSERLQLGTSL